MEANAPTTTPATVGEGIDRPDATARRMALFRWMEANRHRHMERVHLDAAASVAVLSTDARGPCFDDGTFAELAEFIAEMPF